ncbi:hypothetical protein [Clostridium haemolyticum]|nr:hypothetical protein [Clostridium haemolyticum]
MKQTIIKHIVSMEKELYDISKLFVIENPEESFCEHKAHVLH